MQRYYLRYKYGVDYYLREISSSYPYVVYYSDLIYSESSYKCFTDTEQTYLSKCNFSEKFKKCNINSINTPIHVYFYLYDWLELSAHFNYLFKNYFSLILSISGILANVLLILVLSNENMKDKMYIYMKINCHYNLIHSLISLFKFIIYRCDNSYSTRLFYNLPVQYANLILVKLIGNTVRNCSNIAHVSFTLSRYLMITKRSNCFLNNLSTRKILNYLVLTFLFSILINSTIFFTYSVLASDSDTLQLHPFYIEKYLYSYKTETSYDYKERLSNRELLILRIVNFIRIILLDLIYILISVWIDFLLFMFVRKKMKVKSRIRYQSAIRNLIVMPIHMNQPANRKKSNCSSKYRISKMILLNSLNFLLFRLPLVVISFYGFIFRYDIETRAHLPNLVSYIVCKSFKFCANLDDALNAIYLLSYVLQFVIIYKTDTNFFQSFNIMVEKMLRYKKKS